MTDICEIFGKKSILLPFLVIYGTEDYFIAANRYFLIKRVF